MVGNMNLLFKCAVTAALLLPCIAGNAFEQEVQRARKIAAQHKLVLPDELDNTWVRKSDDSVSEAGLLTRCFVNRKGEEVTVFIRQSPVFEQIHDFTDCLIANARFPVFEGIVDLSTRHGHLYASRIASKANPQCLSLLWFQDDVASAPDKWAWRWRLLTNKPGVPICREVRVVKRCTSNPEHDLQILKNIASSVYAVPL